MGHVYHLWHVWIYCIFPHNLMKARFSEKKKEPTLCVFLVFTTFSEICPIQRRSERDFFKNVYSSSSKVPVTLVMFYEICIFSTDCRKIHKCQISRKSCHWELSSSMRLGRRRDRHDETKGFFSQFFVHAKKKKSNHKIAAGPGSKELWSLRLSLGPGLKL